MLNDTRGKQVTEDVSKYYSLHYSLVEQTANPYENIRMSIFV